ncbi:MAG: hypothetical protein BWY73_00912 [candidate division TA06 bacterium ADurb.Bin417]|uniref:Urease accessory protein UreH-like transmembrane domain-containing protein n=1 Tax=candidate division TA06 bacterium ADurb.Bin417 TaxID=1852828 RepID=A0A1V5MH83_UNCT6|nr:MAG: hypothetical protein BWY73_00912 [candidate division TA06 bacterium ADurb.Bin417]
MLGISPCPPFLLGLSRSLAGGRFLDPILFFLGFYLGSSLWLLLLLAGGRLKAGRIFQRIGQAAALAAGIWYLGQGIRMLL